jgi:hypothetical protein
MSSPILPGTPQASTEDVCHCGHQAGAPLNPLEREHPHHPGHGAGSKAHTFACARRSEGGPAQWADPWLASYRAATSCERTRLPLSSAREIPMPRMIWLGEALQPLFQLRLRPCKDVDHVPGSPQQVPACQR